MEDYKPNSHKSREQGNAEKKKVEKVISGKAKLQQKSGARKFADVFVSEDAANVKSYIFSDVLIPAVKKLITDIVKDGIDMVLYGGTRSSSSKGIRGDYVSYSRRYDDRDDRYSHRSESRSISKPEYVTVDTKGDALYVIEQMDALIEEYKVVSVADLYDLVGIEHNYTDNKYGWTNIRNAKPVRLRDGRYAIDLPKALPLD